MIPKYRISPHAAPSGFDGPAKLVTMPVFEASSGEVGSSLIVGGLDVAQRWGVSEGQLALASKIINSQAINRVVREYIDGNIQAAAAVAKMNEELAGIQ